MKKLIVYAGVGLTGMLYLPGRCVGAIAEKTGLGFLHPVSQVMVVPACLVGVIVFAYASE